MRIGFKDHHGGFYQVEVDSEADLPPWTKGLIRLTDEQRAAEVVGFAPQPIQNIVSIETQNPITHRALREFFLGFGEANPAFKATLLYQRVKSVDDAIKAERVKL